MTETNKHNSRPALAMEALKHFRVLYRASNQHFAKIEKQAGISGAQLWALSEIANQPGCTLGALAAAMSIHQSTASNLVEKLAQQGMLEKVRSEQDRRVIHLHATEHGKQCLISAPSPAEGMLPYALKQMPPDRLQVLIGLLIELSSHIPGGDPLLPLSRL